MTTILIKSEQCFFVRLCSSVSFRMIMLCFAKYETYETGFRMQGVFFREIRNSFCMKFSRILYERNSSVNPSFNCSQCKVRATPTWAASAHEKIFRESKLYLCEQARILYHMNKGAQIGNRQKKTANKKFVTLSLQEIIRKAVCLKNFVF